MHRLELLGLSTKYSSVSSPCDQGVCLITASTDGSPLDDVRDPAVRVASSAPVPGPHEEPPAASWRMGASADQLVDDLKYQVKGEHKLLSKDSFRNRLHAQRRLWGGKLSEPALASEASPCHPGVIDGLGASLEPRLIHIQTDVLTPFRVLPARVSFE
jgi:hypothetical protein